MIVDLIFTFFIDLLLIFLPLFWLLGGEKSPRKAMHSLGFQRVGFWELFKKSAKIFLLLICLSIWLALALQFLGLNDLEVVSESIEEAKAVFPLLFWIVVVRVVSEEVFFRGFLVNAIGVLPSTLIFAVLHATYGSIAEVIGAFFLGLVLAKAFQLNKNLYPNILAHIAYNAIAMGVLLG